MELCWSPLNVNQPIPDNALVGGHDVDGSTIYVGRAMHQGDILPVKFIPNYHTAYVSWGGMEHIKQNFDVLIGNHFEWKNSSDGKVPNNAVPVGRTQSGEVLYLGRARYKGSLCVGKIHGSHGCLYIPFAGHEISITSYSVLVFPQDYTWVTVAPVPKPPSAVVAGVDKDGSTIYVGRASHENEMRPAKVISGRNIAYVSYMGKEYCKTKFDVLTGEGYFWMRSLYNVIPTNAVSTGQTKDGRTMFVGRATHDNCQVVGYVTSKQDCLLAPYAGTEVHLKEYEILVKQHS